MSSNEETDLIAPTTKSLQQHALRFLLTTQVLFFAALAWCVLLVHNYDAENSGISFYGAHHRTVLIAIFGYVAAAIGLWSTSSLFRQRGFEPLVWIGLRVVAVMLILLLVTPYNEGTFLNWSHMTIGVVGALVQLAISYWFLRRLGSISLNLGFSLQLAGGIFSALSLPDWSFHFLLYTEIIFQLGFCWCLLEGTKCWALDEARSY
jgi:hypothetical protein